METIELIKCNYLNKKIEVIVLSYLIADKLF